MGKTESKKKHQSRKNLYIALAVGGLVAAVLVVGVSAFFISPERRLAQGFANLVTADSIGVEGVLKNKARFGSTTVQLNAVTDKQQLQADVQVDFVLGESGKASADLDVIVPEDGILYAKINEPQVLATQLKESYVSSLFGEVLQFADSEMIKLLQDQAALSLDKSVELIDGQWIKLSEEQLRQTVRSDAQSDCYVEFARELDANPAARKELAAAYAKHQFIVIEDNLKSEGMSQGYRVSMDQARLKEFKEGVSKNDAVKKLDSCGLDVLTLGASDNLNDSSVDIWVNRWNGDITRMKYEKSNADKTGSSSSVDLKFEYGVKVDVEQPHESVNLREAAPEIFFPRPSDS